MEYTKGDWKVTESAFNRFTTYRSKRSGGRIFVTFGEELGMIAEVQGDTQEEADANARLIAAAPDMYEALEAIMGEPNFGLPGHLFIKAFEAVNKAKGV